MGDVASGHAGPHVCVLGLEVRRLHLPKQRLCVFRQRVVPIPDLDRVVFGWVPLWEDSIGCELVVQRPPVIADVCVEEEDVAPFLRTDVSHARDPPLVFLLPLLQHGDGVSLLRPLLVNRGMARSAHEHEILDGVERCAGGSRIAAPGQPN